MDHSGAGFVDLRSGFAVGFLSPSIGHQTQSGGGELPAGTAERLLPVTETITENGTIRKVTRQHVVPTTVSVFQFALFDD